MNTPPMSIIPKVIHDLLDELEASKQSRLPAWNALQRLRSVLSEVGNVAIPAPAQKTFDAEGELLEHALTKSFRIRNEAMKSLCSSVRRFRDATIKEDCKSDYPESPRSGGGSDPKLTHVRTIQTNHFGRRTCSPLSYRDSTATGFADSWNIAPTQDVLTMRLHPETKQRTLDTLRWGLIPNWAKDPKVAYKTINARAETVDTAPSFRQPFKKRRCLVPVDGFYERKKVPGGKIPFSISMKDDSPFVFAGLWEGWEDPANHEDRMKAWPISSRVNSPKNDDAEIIVPIELSLERDLLYDPIAERLL
jgi:putative SOS response-associated peptidase YedK